MKITKLLGINNRSDSVRAHPSSDFKDQGAVFLTQGSNIDLDADFMPHRRDGFTLKLSGSYKSVWSNNDIMLAVLNGNLVRLDVDNAGAVTLLSTLVVGVGDLDMEYETIDKKAFYTNGVVIGYVEDGVANTLIVPTVQYKRAMPPGQLMTYYKNRLYIARDNIIIASDATAVQRYDQRNDAIVFHGKVTMLKAVDDGLFISDNKYTFFYQGTYGKFTEKKLADYSAVIGTAKTAKGIIVGGDFYDSVVLWKSEKGICVGGNGGKFTNLTEANNNVVTARKGAGLIRRGAINQYLAMTIN